MNENKILNFIPRSEADGEKPEGKKTKEAISLDRKRVRVFEEKFEELTEKLKVIEAGQSYGDNEPGRLEKAVEEYYQEVDNFIADTDNLCDRLEKESMDVHFEFEKMMTAEGDQAADKEYGEELKEREFELHQLVGLMDQAAEIKLKLEKLFPQIFRSIKKVE